MPPLFPGFYITVEGSIPLVDVLNGVVQLYKIREMTISFMFNFQMELLSKLPINININSKFFCKETCASFPFTCTLVALMYLLVSF